MNSPQFSVIVPTLDPGPLLSRALTSIRLQGHHVGEILIVDGGSTSVDIGEFASHDVRILGGAGVSLVDAWNQGIESATSPWIAFLDSDDYWLPGCLSFHLQALADVREITGELPPAATGRIRFECNEAKPPAQFRSHLLDEEPVGWMPGSTVVRADEARAIGSFQSGLGVASDIEWIVRLRDHADFAITDQVVLTKNVRATSVSMASSEGGSDSPYSRDLLNLARQRVATLNSRTHDQ